jgi:hypothetical protein
MKKQKLWVLCLLSTLVLTACDSTSPTAAVGEASLALKANDLPRFRNVLTGSALREYGNSSGMRNLQKKFTGQNLSIASTAVLKSIECGPHCTDTLYRLHVAGGPQDYDVDVSCKDIAVLARKAALYTHVVVCKISDLSAD